MATMPDTRSVTRTTEVSLSPLARLAGPIALAAGSLFTITQLMAYTRYVRIDLNSIDGREILLTDPIYTATTVVLFVAFCLLLLALVAMDRWQERRTSVLGLIGFIAALSGTMFMAGDMWFEAFAVPWIGDVAFDALLTRPSGTLVIGALATYVLFSLGWVLFGSASLRARLSGCHLSCHVDRGYSDSMATSALRRAPRPGLRGARCMDAAQIREP